MLHDDIPAFPIPLNEGQSYQGHAPCDGMTMRDYFAGLAMQSYLSWDDADSWSEDDHARAAYKMADAMLKARGN